MLTDCASNGFFIYPLNPDDPGEKVPHISQTLLRLFLAYFGVCSVILSCRGFTSALHETFIESEICESAAGQAIKSPMRWKHQEAPKSRFTKPMILVVSKFAAQCFRKTGKMTEFTKKEPAHSSTLGSRTIKFGISSCLLSWRFPRTVFL